MAFKLKRKIENPGSNLLLQVDLVMSIHELS